MVVIDIRDVGKDDKEILTDLIYETNKTRIPLTKIQYGIPEALDTRPDISTDHNTIIPVEVAPEYSILYEGGGLLYRRIHIADYLSQQNIGSLEFHTLTFPVPLSAILPQINTQLEYPIDIKDVISYQIDQSGVQPIKLQMNPKSLIWIGEASIEANVVNDGLMPMYTAVAIRGFDMFGAGPYTGLQN